MQTIKPSKGRVLAQRNDKESKINGFFLNDNESYQPDMATVVSTSSEQYKVNDVVIYKTYAVQDLKLEGREYFIINEEDILGVVHEDNL